MPSRFLAWLEAQPQGRRRLYSALIALSLVTLPCYAGGLALRILDVRPPAAPEPQATAESQATATASATARLIPTVAAPPTWTVVWRPPVEDPAETAAATLEPGAPTPEPSVTAAASATPEAATSTPVPTDAPTAEPSAAPTVAPTAEAPTAQPEPTGEPPTPIGGFTPQPAAP